MKPIAIRRLGIPLIVALWGGATLAACEGAEGPQGPEGPAGTACEVVENEGTVDITCGDTSVSVPAGVACVVVDDETGATITCDDSSATVTDGDDGEPGVDGEDGTSCTVEEVDETTSRITCDDGTDVVVTDGVDGLDGSGGADGVDGVDGVDGRDGLNAGETPGLFVALAANTPDRGYYEAGEAITLTATLTDSAGLPVEYGDLSTLGLYLTGPRDVVKNRAAVELIRATTDRAARPHHYVDLHPGDEGVMIEGGTVTFTTEAITDEEAGTYTFNLRVFRSGFDADQVQATLDVQIGTAEVEPMIVDGCGDCHEGTNGQFYMHHVDPGRSPYGTPSIDSAPITTCYACHTTDGYAAFTVDGERVPDAIVIRAHGVHNGANLVNPLNIDEGGVFGDYATVEFPAGITNCESCHVEGDDSWYTKPSTLACGSCHDRVDWETGAYVVPNGELTEHPGGSADEGPNCASCHGSGTGGIAPIRPAHEEAASEPPYDITFELSAPTNGSFYVDEEPTLTIQFLDATTGTPADPATFGTSYQRAQLLVYGPRGDARPVLTNVATATGSSYQYVDLRLNADGLSTDERLTRTATAWQYALYSVDGLEPGTYFAMIRARGANGVPYSSGITSFQVGIEAETALVATDCTRCHAEETMHGYAPFDTDWCVACHDYNRGYPDRAGWDNSNYGFGVPPLTRIVHQAHFGHYLQNNDEFEDIIFPQDVRNCETCHAESDTWQTEPSRLACNGCHDSTDVEAHLILMTVDRTPEDAYSGDELESCGTCHGDGDEFSVWNAHNIQDPYSPPYPREAE